MCLYVASQKTRQDAFFDKVQLHHTKHRNIMINMHGLYFGMKVFQKNLCSLGGKIYLPLLATRRHSSIWLFQQLREGK